MIVSSLIRADSGFYGLVRFVSGYVKKFIKTVVKREKYLINFQAMKWFFLHMTTFMIAYLRFLNITILSNLS